MITFVQDLFRDENRDINGRALIEHALRPQITLSLRTKRCTRVKA